MDRARIPEPSEGRVDRGLWWLGWGLVVLGAGFALNSLLGPFLTDQIDYPVSETMRNQTIGLDAATLLVVAPVTIAVGVLTMRGHRAGPVLALAPTSYGAYVFVQYIAGPDHLTYPNVLILQLLLFGGSWLLTAAAWTRAKRSRVETMSRWHGYVAWLLGGFVLLRYVPGLAASFTNEALPDEVTGDPAMYWLIVLLDLGVFVPVAVLAGIGLFRDRSWAPLLYGGLVGWFTLVTVAVGAMSIAMIANDDRYASTGQLGLFVVVGVLMTAYAAVVYRPLFMASDVAADGGLGRSSDRPSRP